MPTSHHSLSSNRSRQSASLSSGMQQKLTPHLPPEPQPHHAPASTKIIPLAHPKQVKLCCELCGEPAHLSCATCKLTFYCNKAHQLKDYQSIHPKICHLLIPLRRVPDVLGSKDERKMRELENKEIKMQLLDLTKTEAHKKLISGEFDLAIPAAMQALKVSMDLYGSDSIELVNIYLFLGEACIGLKNYNQAEEYLSLAKWGLLKSRASVEMKGLDRRESNADLTAGMDELLLSHDNVVTTTTAKLYRNFGLLYESKGALDLALEYFAKDVYLSSSYFGDNCVTITGSYFQLSNVFLKQNRRRQVLSVYNKIISIWIEYLDQSQKGKHVIPLDEAQQAEALQILVAIESYLRNLFKSSTEGGELHPYQVTLTSTEFALARFNYYVLKDKTKAKDIVLRVIQENEGNPDKAEDLSKMKEWTASVG
ncbi:hypothetical protein BKA69DRAFT_339260 [Paraphysoderma sedebokerense]|nr:hypothetical protein BKA69DRAFT_339260 [Paraphysoderma sedebokerense]